MDRLERSLRLCLKQPARESRELRISAAKLGVYARALKERDAAKAALPASPEDSKAHEILSKAEEALDRAREDLKH